jgi:2'-5' RNA ligase
MTAAPRYALWLLLAEPAHARYADLIRRLSERHATPPFEPHVTLLGKIAGEETGLVARAEQLARELAPFDIQLLDAVCLDEYFRALFIEVALAPPLNDARAAACRRFGRRAADEFYPHLSLLYGDLPEREKESILDDIGRYFDETVRIDRIALWRVDGAPAAWRALAHCALGGSE